MARHLYQRTEGNPFLLVTLADDLVTRGVIKRNNGQWTFPQGIASAMAGVPTTLRRFIEKHLDRLPSEDQQVLLAASVAGGSFSAALVAATLNINEGIVDQCCAALARRRQFLQPAEGSIHTNQRRLDRFTFRHALSREVCLERLTTGQRRQFHHRIGVWKEGAYGQRSATLAAELAVHFDHGHDPQRAVHYYHQAAENAVRRYASQEAVTRLRRALELLPEVPDTPQRVHLELGLLFQLRVQLGCLKGEATPELKVIVQRIQDLSQQVEPTAELFWAFTGVFLFYLIQEELQTAQGLAQQRVQLACRFPSPLFAMAAHTELGITSFFLGEPMNAQEHLQRAIDLYDPHAPHPFFFDWEHGPPCFCYAAFVSWQLGYADKAHALIRQALMRSRTLHLPYMEAFTLNCATLLAALSGEAKQLHQQATAAITVAETHEFSGMVEMAKIYLGWAQAQQEHREDALHQMQQSMSAYQVGGGDAFRAAHLALYAESCCNTGHPTEGLTAVDEALSLSQRTGGRYYDAELYRVKGEITLQKSRVQSPESRKVQSPKSEVRSPTSKPVQSPKSRVQSLRMPSPNP